MRERRKTREESRSFLKKRTKKLLSIGRMPLPTDWAPRGKVFASFFQKRRFFLTLV
jgi:hypothetical protein